MEYKRDASGWTIFLAAQPSNDPNRGEWAGYCWDISPVDGSGYSSLVMDLPEVSQATEVEVKLERQDNRVQESKTEYLHKGLIDIDLTCYPRIRPEIARLCIMAIGQPTAKAPTVAKFVFARALLR